MNPDSADATPRILFHATNRRGLGHLMRATNLAHALLAIEPAARIALLLRRAPPQGLRDDRLLYLLEDEKGSPSAKLAREFAPDIVVRDTLPAKQDSDDLRVPGRSVFVLRRCHEDRQQMILRHPSVVGADLLVVPHTKSEFQIPIPPALSERTVFVGPVVRLPTPEGQRIVKERFGLDDSTFVVTSTAGGGGFLESTESFLRTIFAAHLRIREKRPDFRHIVIPGPYFEGSLEAPPGVELIEEEPELVSLFACSDLVLAQAGYNTVQELRVAHTPALFLPGERSADDQRERAMRVADQKLGFVVADGSVEEKARRIADIASDEGRLGECRARLRRQQIPIGNREAALRILALLR